MNGDGRIAIETAAADGEVEVTIRDNGRGMSPEQADTIFDPIFKVAGWARLERQLEPFQFAADRVRARRRYPAGDRSGAGHRDAHYAAGCLMYENTPPQNAGCFLRAGTSVLLLQS